MRPHAELTAAAGPAPPQGPARAGLEVVEVSVEYAGRRVVDRVSFSIRPGTILGLVGESGSGKTTLARALVGSVPATTGSVRLDGVELGRRRTRQERRALQLVPQDPFGSLNPLLTVGGVLEELLREVHFTQHRVRLFGREVPAP